MIWMFDPPKISRILVGNFYISDGVKTDQQIYGEKTKHKVVAYVQSQTEHA